MSRRLLYAQAVVLALVAVLDIHFGLNLRYFWIISWWDIPLHMLGGVWIALFGAWIASLFNKRISVFQCVLLALSIGVGWEVFEYAVGLGGSVFMSYRLDTAKDLFDDAVGGTIAGYSVRKFI
jgi:hypothetical protein